MKALITAMGPFALFLNAVIWLALLAGVTTQAPEIQRANLDLVLLFGALLCFNIFGLLALPRKPR